MAGALGGGLTLVRVARPLAGLPACLAGDAAVDLPACLAGEPGVDPPTCVA